MLAMAADNVVVTVVYEPFLGYGKARELLHTCQEIVSIAQVIFFFRLSQFMVVGVYFKV